MLILMQNLSLKGPFCRAHGMAAVKRMTIRSLLFGWWGVISLFVANPLTLILNGVAWMRIRGLPEPIGEPVRAAVQPPAYPEQAAPPSVYAQPPPGYMTPPPQGYPPRR